MTFRTEQELAAVVVEHYSHLPVYQEVTYKGSVADIVVDCGHAWIIEAKKSFSLDVVAQAEWWIRSCSANKVSIAVPVIQRSSKSYRLRIKMLKWLGVGLIEVDKHGAYEKVRPQIFRYPKHTTILGSCVDAHQTYAVAGNSSGERWTPYKETMLSVRLALQAHGTLGVKDLLKKINHHYRTDSTARSCLVQWLTTIEAEKGWVSFDRGGYKNSYRFWLTGVNNV